jgi:hypothetical protein
LTAGCATSSMPDEMRSEIPASATTVQLHSDLPPDELYQGPTELSGKKGFGSLKRTRICIIYRPKGYKPVTRKRT